MSAQSRSRVANGKFTWAARRARTFARGICCARSTRTRPVLKIAGRFLQYYREQGRYLERTYAFVPRVGIDKIRAVVVEDSEGIAERLDLAMQRSVDAYQDPWQEAVTPATANQFGALLPIVQ